jgi:hypothetical protein
MLYNELRSFSQPGHKYMLFCNRVERVRRARLVFKSPVVSGFLPYLGSTATLTGCQIRKFVTTATATATAKKPVATEPGFNQLQLISLHPMHQPLRVLNFQFRKLVLMSFSRPYMVKGLCAIYPRSFK